MTSHRTRLWNEGSRRLMDDAAMREQIESLRVRLVEESDACTAYAKKVAEQGETLRHIGRKLDLARLTERYQKDEGFASFIDDLITEVMDVYP